MSENTAATHPISRELTARALQIFGMPGPIGDILPYISYMGNDGLVKLIFRITLTDGRMLVMKVLHEAADLAKDREKIEQQSLFSEAMRRHGVATPRRYEAHGRFCHEMDWQGIACNVTLEDWCGTEILEITPDIARRIGVLMAEMHTLSLAQQRRIGCGTLFSAAYWNDVDAWEDLCRICRDERLDQTILPQLTALREEKLCRLRACWDSLPRAAVQGDISINNLVDAPDGLIVFDYNNAGDEVLVSDLVMEGLLTAYEMDLPVGVPEESREALFTALLTGYLSVRPLNAAEQQAAWDIYTLYHALWFSRIIYNDHSLQKLTEANRWHDANALLRRMLNDLRQADDGRFSA